MYDEQTEDEGRRICRGMVEDHWRTFLGFAATGSEELGRNSVRLFDQAISDGASQMSPHDGALYTAMMEEERERIFDEYSRNPAALKERLGVTAGRPPQASRDTHGLGELAVRTAVRATIWSAIRAVFR